MYYIGQQKIAKLDLPKEGWVRYELENKQHDLVTVDQLQSLKSEAPYEDQNIRERKWRPLVKKLVAALRETEINLDEADIDKRWDPVTVKMLGLLLDYDFPAGEQGFIISQLFKYELDVVLNKLNNSVNVSFDKAVSKKFSRPIQEQIRFSQVAETLKTETPFIEE